MTDYPSGTFTPSTWQDNVDDVAASVVNNPNNEIKAIETDLIGTGISGGLKQAAASFYANWIAQHNADGTHKDISAGAIVATGDIYTTARYDYFATSTKVGWAATPTGTIYIKKIGKTVFVDVYISGTSNGTTTTFTLPYTHHAGTATESLSCRVRDSGNWKTVPGLFFLDISSNVGVVFLDGLSTNLFTASGEKTIWGQFRYEAA